MTMHSNSIFGVLSPINALNNNFNLSILKERDLNIPLRSKEQNLINKNPFFKSGK